MKVLVLDGDSRVALAALRSLGRRGCEVDCAERESVPSPLGFRSRYVRRRIRLRSLDPESLVEAARGHDVVLATTRRSVDALATGRAAVEACGARVPLAAAQRIRAANDKSHVHETGRALGIATPETWNRIGNEELAELERRVAFPAIVKLRRDEGPDLAPAERYAIVQDGEGLRRAWERLSALQPRPLVQQWIDGVGLGVGMLLTDEGEVLARFTHLRQRELPPSGGPSTACVSVHHAGAEEAALRLLRALGVSGAAMVEFRLDRRTGTPYLLEVNPRLWGSLELPIRCGVDFPWLLCRWAMGDPARATEYRDGVHLRFLALDALAVVQAWKEPRLRGAYLGGFLRDLLLRRPYDGVFRGDDPSPGFGYVSSRLASVFGSCASSR